jgi:cytochrome P460
MTSKPGLKTISCILLVLLFCTAKWAGSLSEAQYSASGLQASDLESLKAELSGYRTWTLVNPRRVLMDPVLAADCAAPNIRGRSPHSNKYISVYVNDLGRTAMMSEKYPKFPQGSIIVKAKSSEESGGSPELLTIMVKRGEGYDQGNGNWEYLVMDGDGSRVERPANVESCQRCHLARKDTDYVSRVYLPNAVREKLR